MGEFVKVARVSDVPVGTMKQYEVNHRQIVICHTDNGLYTLADEYSHDSAPISDGRLDGHEIVCLRHGAKFDVRDGHVTGPPAVVGIDQYETEIRGDDIYVLLD